MQRSGMQWNGGEEEAAICTLPRGIRYKKHAKPELTEILISCRPTISIMYVFPLAQRQRSARQCEKQIAFYLRAEATQRQAVLCLFFPFPTV
jgi:hypothetical protein